MAGANGGRINRVDAAGSTGLEPTVYLQEGRVELEGF